MNVSFECALVVGGVGKERVGGGGKKWSYYQGGKTDVLVFSDLRVKLDMRSQRVGGPCGVEAFRNSRLFSDLKSPPPAVTPANTAAHPVVSDMFFS